jgi:uncharacterized membrane protein (DUF485 family)
VSTTDDRRAGGIPVATYESVQKSPDFQQLRRSYRGFSFPMTVAFLAWYALYVLLSVFAPDFMATDVFGTINVGILLGLGQFASTALITWLYVRHANNRLDPLATEIRDEMEGNAA